MLLHVAPQTWKHSREDRPSNTKLNKINKKPQTNHYKSINREQAIKIISQNQFKISKQSTKSQHIIKKTTEKSSKTNTN
jgi:hypothetical protein